MAGPGESKNVYQDKSRIKWIVLVISVLISLGSILYTNILVDQLKERERDQTRLFARALEYTINEESGSNINFIARQIFENKSIPTILTNQSGEIIDFRNIAIDSTKMSEKLIKGRLEKTLAQMREEYETIPVTVKESNGSNIVFGYVNYSHSILLTQLIYYPYIQLSVIAIFAFIAYMAFNYSKAAEQNRVWVGLAKETAHQLGTPLSSLMAWVEIIREDPDLKDKNIASEIDKDIQRLQLITERFSSIGSVPVLRDEDIYQVVSHAIKYLRPRISSRVDVTVNYLSPNIRARINKPLFEWVLENLCKNSVDAMDGTGKISIDILRGSDSRVLLDIHDTGKGIPKSKIKSVFNPGFTSKKRGWGLGLTLAKRIIEHYHRGKIYVKISEENTGTTFRISLPSYP